MTTPPTDVQIPVPLPVQTTAKTVVATMTTVLGVFTLFGTMISDGLLTWGEGGTLIGAVITAGTTIYGVWRIPNQAK